jgi:hypothetical protein
MNITTVELKPRHEIDVIVNGDTVHRGTIFRFDDGVSDGGLIKWSTASYVEYTIESLELIIKAMKGFKS